MTNREPILVGATELRARLAYYLRRAQNGQNVRITLRGEPTAELRPPPNATAD